MSVHRFSLAHAGLAMSAAGACRSAAITSDADVDVLRTITIWVYAGLSPADAYEGLIGVRPQFDPSWADLYPSWADIQDLAWDLRRRLPEHAPAGPSSARPTR